jgi:hypothetical protein
MTSTGHAICAALVGIASILPLAVPAADSAPPGILGYLDPSTGTFKIAHATSELSEAAAAAISTVTGEIKVTATFTIVSAIATTTPITCSASVSVVSDAEGYVSDSSSALATRSGSTATCTVTIPYEWSLSTPTTDLVSLSVIAVASQGTTLERTSTRSLPSFKVPASGATSSFSYATHL